MDTHSWTPFFSGCQAAFAAALMLHNVAAQQWAGCVLVDLESRYMSDELHAFSMCGVTGVTALMFREITPPGGHWGGQHPAGVGWRQVGCVTIELVSACVVILSQLAVAVLVFSPVRVCLDLSSLISKAACQASCCEVWHALHHHHHSITGTRYTHTQFRPCFKLRGRGAFFTVVRSAHTQACLVRPAACTQPAVIQTSLQAWRSWPGFVAISGVEHCW